MAEKRQSKESGESKTGRSKTSSIDVETAQDPNGRSATVSLDSVPKDAEIVVEVITPDNTATYRHNEDTTTLRYAFKIGDEGEHEVRVFAERTDEGGNTTRERLGSKRFTV